MAGFVAIYRELIGDPQFRGKDDEYAAIWLVCKAAWKAHTARVGRHSVVLERGQFACTISYLSEAWECSKSTVHGRLKHLEKNKFIRTQVRTGFTLISICNYSKYQDALVEPERNPERSPNASPNADYDGGRTQDVGLSYCYSGENDSARESARTLAERTPERFSEQKNGNKVLRTGGGGRVRDEKLVELQSNVIRTVQSVSTDRLRTSFVRGDQKQLSIVAGWINAEHPPEAILKIVATETERLTAQGETISSLNYFSKAIERLTQNGPTPSAAPKSQGIGLSGRMKAAQRSFYDAE
ncbi:hypothetical protein [Terasakiella pusilla]|uniref:hypothetical protein n=1 Tax=Terasakiella pusilla TaxID=64973 RepID=UPI003AA9B2A9